MSGPEFLTDKERRMFENIVEHGTRILAESAQNGTADTLGAHMVRTAVERAKRVLAGDPQELAAVTWARMSAGKLE